jgi:putative membrane protein
MMFAAAVAAALAMPGAAQTTRRETIGERARRPAVRQQPAPAPQTAAQGQAVQPAQAQAPLSEQQRTALGAVYARNKLAIQAGEMAATRGASEEVRSLGRRLLDEHRSAETELGTYVGQRGADVNALPSSPDRQRIEAEVGQLSSRSGEEFDRELIAFVTRNHASFVEDLKRARDVTPGKDAAFKQWLDGYENREEEHLSAARQLKAQRQARKPPAR